MDLERENQRLREQLDTARDRASQMLDRVRFLRQQATLAGAGAGASAATSGNGGSQE